ncbi:MAG: hypothetical protein Q7O66_08110, partial [Dehalococcoidia bacterium]|nr:hypothetical protein [Dehalococcoidia bacterium]
RSTHPRAAEPSAIIPLFEARGVSTMAAPDVQSALRKAKRIARPGDLILATGSLFVVAEVLAVYSEAAGEGGLN